MKENKIVITDACCFIILEKIGGLQFLNELYAHVYTTPEIAAEYRKRLPEWVTVKAVENRDLLYTYADSIDIGEASAMALAAEIHADLLITDDGGARKFDKKIHLPYTGSIGVLLSAKQNGIITAVKPYMEKIQHTNFRISATLIEKIIHGAGE